MLERVALHQTRFRTPGVTPDPRGVLLGQLGVVLFPSIDRLVAFLRAYGDAGTIDDLVPTMRLKRLTTPLRTQEIMLQVAAESSYRMDRIAGVAKLAGGQVFTGTSRHFVKYRDNTSPLGYDVVELLDESADLILYHDSFRQTYEVGRDIALRDLVLKLTPYRRPPDQETLARQKNYWISAEMGVGHAVLTYLFRWRVDARAAIAEWPPQSAFEDNDRRLYVFDVVDPPPRIIELLRGLPGVRVFVPAAPGSAVELGFEHPIALDSCASLFDEASLVLFQGDGEVTIVDPLPPFAPVRTLVRTGISDGDAPHTRAADGNTDALSPLALDLRLAASTEPWRNVTAAVVPIERREWLARLLYALPPKVIAALQMAVGEQAFYLLDADGIEGVPLGTFYSEIALDIFVPSGFTLVPAVSPAVLVDLVRPQQEYVFFTGEGLPQRIAKNNFGPVSRRALREVAATSLPARTLDVSEPELPLFRYDKARRFPLWGLPKAGESED